MKMQWIALLLVSLTAHAATVSRLDRKDGSVLSPVPDGTRLEAGDRLVVSEGNLKVRLGQTEVVVNAGTNLSVSRGERSFEVFLERGRAETMAAAPSATESVYLVTKDGGRLRADEKTNQLSVAEVTARGPASLQVVEASRELASLPPPPPPVHPVQFGQSQFEPALNVPFSALNNPVPKIELPNVSCATCPSTVRVNVRVQ